MTSPSRQAVYNIAAGMPFATTLAGGICQLAGDAETLARHHHGAVTPSGTGVACCLFGDWGQGGKLLPRIEPLGDVAEDSPELLVIPEIDSLCPPAINPLRRQLTLARLLRGFALGGVALTPPQTVMPQNPSAGCWMRFATLMPRQHSCAIFFPPGFRPIGRIFWHC